MRSKMLENTFGRSGAECFAKVLDGKGWRETKRLGPKLGSWQQTLYNFLVKQSGGFLYSWMIAGSLNYSISRWLSVLVCFVKMICISSLHGEGPRFRTSRQRHQAFTILPWMVNTSRMQHLLWIKAKWRWCRVGGNWGWLGYSDNLRELTNLYETSKGLICLISWPIFTSVFFEKTLFFLLKAGIGSFSSCRWWMPVKKLDIL